MSELLSIPGLDASSRELLEAAGYYDCTDLAKADDRALERELERANRILKLCDTTPDHETVTGWVTHARKQSGIADEDEGPRVRDHERDPRVKAMLRSSPLAIPLPDTALQEKNLAISDVPPGLLLTEYPGNLDVRSEKRIPRARGNADDPVSSIHVVDSSHQSRLDIDVSRLKSLSDAGPKRMRMHTARPTGGNERVDLIRAPKAGTNEGRDPNSRRYVRGVLHPHPGGLYAGAVLTLIMFLFTPVAMASAFLLLLSREMPDTFDWVDKWWLAFPLALPVLSLAWLCWGFSGKCRICNQKLFIHRPHRKNAKAHYVSGLGYVLPLCAHMLAFHWFRCSHCGTPVRLKK